MAALLNHLGYDGGPADLMVSSNPGAVLSVEVLEKENQVLPEELCDSRRLELSPSYPERVSSLSRGSLYSATP